MEFHSFMYLVSRLSGAFPFSERENSCLAASGIMGGDWAESTLFPEQPFPIPTFQPDELRRA